MPRRRLLVYDYGNRDRRFLEALIACRGNRVCADVVKSVATGESILSVQPVNDSVSIVEVDTDRIAGIMDVGRRVAMLGLKSVRGRVTHEDLIALSEAMETIVRAAVPMDERGVPLGERGAREFVVNAVKQFLVRAFGLNGEASGHVIVGAGPSRVRAGFLVVNAGAERVVSVDVELECASGSPLCTGSASDNCTLNLCLSLIEPCCGSSGTERCTNFGLRSAELRCSGRPSEREIEELVRDAVEMALEEARTSGVPVPEGYRAITMVKTERFAPSVENAAHLYAAYRLWRDTGYAHIDATMPAPLYEDPLLPFDPWRRTPARFEVTFGTEMGSPTIVYTPERVWSRERRLGEALKRVLGVAQAA